MRKNVIVVGAPRSGTSMTAYVFASHGYFVAQDPESELREGDENNPTGYWEAQSLIDANVEIFAAVGYPHHNTWLYDAMTDEQAGRIYELKSVAKHMELAAGYNKNAPWLWKDPRLCYTLGYWWPLLNPETTAVLLLTRNIDHVFQSFLRLGWRKSPADRDEVAERVRAHMAAAERAIDRFNIPHIKMAYEAFKNRPEETARQLRDFFGVDVGAQDLKFNTLLNHGGGKGRLVAAVERMAAALPAPGRALIKMLTPAIIWHKLFPGRKK